VRAGSYEVPAFAMPRSNALSPLPPYAVSSFVCVYTTLAHTRRYEHPSPAVLALSGRGEASRKRPHGRPKTSHLADAPTSGTTYSSARGRGRIPFLLSPLEPAPGRPHYWPRSFPIASGAAFVLLHSKHPRTFPQLATWQMWRALATPRGELDLPTMKRSHSRRYSLR
jgi:hypothetical protein